MNPSLHNRHNERGAVLIVALLMLLVTTLVGFSTMETSNLESKMASAHDAKARTFQAAETAIELTVDDEVMIGAAYLGGTDAGTDHDFTGTGLKARVDVDYLGIFPTPGYSATKGSGIATAYYTIAASAQRSGTNISSDHTQGIYVIQPKPN